ncbi:MAG: hypothetical protein LAT50_21565 [Ectothiorhodospiraceae bacterium]|nr:hypothetical protein [Ectothiorhodospiraceae bacterium]
MLQKFSKPHSVSVILGREAVVAYEKGELPQQALRRLGVVRDYNFDSIQELNAFMRVSHDGGH